LSEQDRFEIASTFAQFRYGTGRTLELAFGLA